MYIGLRALVVNVIC